MYKALIIIIFVEGAMPAPLSSDTGLDASAGFVSCDLRLPHFVFIFAYGFQKKFRESLAMICVLGI